jgi:hypothetical protein
VIVPAEFVGVRVAGDQTLQAGDGALSHVLVAFQLPLATER